MRKKKKGWRLVSALLLFPLALACGESLPDSATVVDHVKEIDLVKVRCQVMAVHAAHPGLLQQVTVLDSLIANKQIDPKFFEALKLSAEQVEQLKLSLKACELAPAISPE